MNTDEWPAVARNAYALGVAAERARIVKALQTLRDEYVADDLSTTALREAIVQLTATPAPVASSPVGGEQ